MTRIILAYIVSAIVFFGLDMVWLTTMVDRFYRPRMGALLLERPNLAVAGLFYAVYLAGMQYFAVLPALRDGGWTQALLSGALLGGLAYATYDLTNLSTIRGFPASVAVVDIIWGMLATGVSAAVTTAVVRALGR